MKAVKLFNMFIFLAISLSSLAQRNDLMLTNSQSIEEDLYEGIEGSPFYFDNWQKGKIFPKNESESIEEVWLNFNGYTHSFEIKKGNRFIALDEKWYERVEVSITNQETIVFETNLLPKKKNLFTKLVYQGTDFHVAQVFHANLITTEKERYAGTIEVQEFVAKPLYYFVQNGQVSLMKLKKKNILAQLKDQKSKLESHIKRQKLKLNGETGLVQLLAYYDELSQPITVTNAGEEKQ